MFLLYVVCVYFNSFGLVFKDLLSYFLYFGNFGLVFKNLRKLKQILPSLEQLNDNSKKKKKNTHIYFF